MLETISQNVLFVGSSAVMLAIMAGTHTIGQNTVPIETTAPDRTSVVQPLSIETPSTGGTQSSTNSPATTQQTTVSSPNTPTSSEITSAPAPTKSTSKQTVRRERHEDSDEEDDD